MIRNIHTETEVSEELPLQRKRHAHLSSLVISFDRCRREVPDSGEDTGARVLNTSKTRQWSNSDRGNHSTKCYRDCERIGERRRQTRGTAAEPGLCIQTEARGGIAILELHAMGVDCASIAQQKPSTRLFEASNANAGDLAPL
jgi:hypothetical protein